MNSSSKRVHSTQRFINSKKGQIKSVWRTAENGRERKYYSLTGKGRKTAAEYEKQWHLLTLAIAAILESR